MKRLLRPLHLFALIVLAIAATLWWRVDHGRTVHSPVARGDAEYVRAAHWFGSGWAVNFWSTRLEARAHDDFRRIREDGFNTIVLLVPWPGFAPDPRDGSLDPQRRERLLALIRLAAEHDLDVVLRTSYAWDALADDSAQRLTRLWVDPAYYRGWLGYLDSVWQAVADEPNVRFGFFSWEDLWAVMSFAEAGESERRQAAGDSGYRQWLIDSGHELADLGRLYRREFSNWDQVYVPGRREPAFKLFLQFVDDAWIERFFVPAQRRFPKLSMEIRVDSDPVWDGDRLLEWHSHESAWDLPGAAWTTIYWSPAMGGENRGEQLEPEKAAERLRWMLDRVRSNTGARQIFVGQFLAEDYTPGFEDNGRIPRDQVGRFLRLAHAPLHDFAGGYGLWTWTDYRHDAIANPEFGADLAGWTGSPGGTVDALGVQLPAGGSLRRLLTVHDYHTPGGPQRAELCVDGRSLDQDAASIAVSDVDTNRALGRIVLTPERNRHCLTFAVAPALHLQLEASGPVHLHRVDSAGFVQPTGMRDVDGRLKPIGTDYRWLNANLQKAPSLQHPRYDDGWMGRSMTLRIEGTSTARRLHLRTHLPEQWPKQPRLSIQVDGALIGHVDCRSGGDYTLDLPAAVSRGAAGGFEVQIDSSAVHQVEGDQRALGCVIAELAVEPSNEPAD